MSGLIVFYSVLAMLAVMTKLSFASSTLIVHPGGVYSRLTVDIEEQSQPSDCPGFLDNLEVGAIFFGLKHITFKDTQMLSKSQSSNL